MLRFRDIDVEAESDVQALVDWANDPKIRHLFLRFEDQRAYETPLSLARAQEKLRRSISEGRRLHIIERDGEIVGEVSLDLENRDLPPSPSDTAWFGLVLGREDARGSGLGRKAMMHMESLAKELGASRAQVGVFEFNERAHGLYRDLGYLETGRIPSFTWWQGKLWTNICMSKAL